MSCDFCVPFLSKLVLEMSKRFKVQGYLWGERICCFQLHNLMEEEEDEIEITLVYSVLIAPPLKLLHLHSSSPSPLQTHQADRLHCLSQAIPLQ